MKHNITAFLMIGFLIPLLLPHDVSAMSFDELRKNLEQTKTEIREQMNTNKAEMKKTMDDAKKEIEKAKEEIKINGKVVNGTVSSVSSSTMVVVSEGKTYTITTTDSKVVRNFGGQSTISEISTGDKVSIWGAWTDDSKTSMNAKVVRDLSIMKRFGAFIGTVTSKGDGTFVLQSKERGNQTVTVSSSTKFVNRKGETMLFSDMLVGHRIRVKGMWNKTSNQVTEVTEVRDFTLPIK